MNLTESGKIEWKMKYHCDLCDEDIKVIHKPPEVSSYDPLAMEGTIGSKCGCTRGCYNYRQGHDPKDMLPGLIRDHFDEIEAKKKLIGPPTEGRTWPQWWKICKAYMEESR